MAQARVPVRSDTSTTVDPVVQGWIDAYGESAVATWMAVQSEEAYRNYIPVEKMGAIHDQTTKIVMGLGGNRSGKSYTTFFEFMGRCLGVWPKSLEYKHDPNWRPIKAWVVTRDYPLLREAIDEYFQMLLPQHWIESWNTNQHILQLKNLRDPTQKGSKVSFRSADAGPRKMESAAVDLVFVDEEVRKDVWDALITRTVSKRGSILLAMTPDNGFSWTYDKLYQKYYSPDEKVRARTREWLSVVEATMYDNPHLDPDEIRLLEDAFDDEIVREVRVLGHYAELSGEMVFNATALARMRAHQSGPIESSGSLKVYEPWMEHGVYVIGADVASGVTSGDYSAAVVYEKRNSRVVAVWRGHCQPDEFARHLVDVASRYKNPLMVVERQNHGTSTLIALRDLGYHNLYTHSSSDRVSWSTPSSLLGWDTNPRTKDEAIDYLRSLIGTKTKESTIVVPDATVMHELGAFVYYTDKIPERSPHKLVGRCGAKYGEHDDTVIALAIAAAVSRGEVVRSLTPEPLPPERTPGTFANLLREVESEYEEARRGKQMAVGYGAALLGEVI